jgi:hypothetical protein
VFSRKENITFAGSASDAEDGDISASLTWTSDVSGVIGSGVSFQTKLGPGIHTITATATDSGNASGSASVIIEITARGN